MRRKANSSELEIEAYEAARDHVLKCADRWMLARADVAAFESGVSKRRSLTTLMVKAADAADLLDCAVFDLHELCDFHMVDVTGRLLPKKRRAKK